MSLLPHAHRPGTDLISKAILSEDSVIRIVETGLDLEKNEYESTKTEWKTGKRSDVLLEAKSTDLLPPVLLEIENQINDRSMRKTLDYAREAEKKTGILPVVLIFSTNTIAKTVLDELEDSQVEGCRQYPCTLWATQCLIFAKQFVDVVDKTNLNPFTAMGLFLAEGERSLALSQYSNDVTIKHLYDLAWENLESVSTKSLKIKDKVSSLIEKLGIFCQRIKTKIREKEPDYSTIQYIDEFKTRIGKREREELEDDEEENVQDVQVKKRVKILYTTEEKEFVLSFMGENQGATFEQCRKAGVEKGLFSTREAKHLMNLHSRLVKKK